MPSQATSSTSTSTVEEDRQAARNLINLAYTAELAGEWKQAFNLHTRAGNLLLRAVAKGNKKSEERRKDRLLLRGTIERRMVLRVAAEGHGPPPALLPSRTTQEREVACPDGKILLTMVENGSWGSLVDQTEAIEGLVFDENQVPYFTPMLPPSTTHPDVEFNVYPDSERRRAFTRVYFHIKDSTKSQTLYTLYGVKKVGYQIPWCTLSRVAEYDSICGHVDIAPIPEISVMAYNNARAGRVLTTHTCSRTIVIESIDRPRYYWTRWCPRRFTYGGRRFVWKDERKFTKEREALYEVKREFPLEGSKTGKMDDETFDRPLAWVLGKWSLRKACRIGMVGGLDQGFQEYIFTSAMSKLMVVQHGHERR